MPKEKMLKAQGARLKGKTTWPIALGFQLQHDFTQPYKRLTSIKSANLMSIDSKDVHSYHHRWI
jgi:hypothetical protein